MSAKRERKVWNARGGREEAIRMRKRKIPPIKRGINPCEFSRHAESKKMPFELTHAVIKEILIFKVSPVLV